MSSDLARRLSESEALVERLREQVKSKEGAIDDLMQDSVNDLNNFRVLIQEKTALQSERDSLKLQVASLSTKLNRLEKILNKHSNQGSSESEISQEQSPVVEPAKLTEQEKLNDQPRLRMSLIKHTDKHHTDEHSKSTDHKSKHQPLVVNSMIQQIAMLIVIIFASILFLNYTLSI